MGEITTETKEIKKKKKKRKEKKKRKDFRYYYKSLYSKSWKILKKWVIF
jgi:hypothetical protein